MPYKYARSNGNFNDSSIWSLLPGSMSPTTVPDQNDVALTNGFSVNITGNITVSGLRSDAINTATPGNTFYVQDGVIITGDILGGGNRSIDSRFGTQTSATVTYTGSNFFRVHSNTIQASSSTTANQTGPAAGGGVWLRGTGTGFISAVNFYPSDLGNAVHVLSGNCDIRAVNLYGGGYRIFNGPGGAGVLFDSSGWLNVNTENVYGPWFLINGGAGSDAGGRCSGIYILNALSATINAKNIYGGSNIVTNTEPTQHSGIVIRGNGGIFYINCENIYGDFFFNRFAGSAANDDVENYGIRIANNSGMFFINCLNDIVGGSVGGGVNVVSNSSTVSIRCRNVVGGLFAPAKGYGLPGIRSTGNHTLILSATNLNASGGPAIRSSNTGNLIVHNCNLYFSQFGVSPIASNNFTIGKYTDNFIKYPGSDKQSSFNLGNFQSLNTGVYSLPPLSSIRVGTYTGATMRVPPLSSVLFGVKFDTDASVTGTAILTNNILFETNINALSTNNTIGNNVRQALTTQAGGHLIASFSN